MDGLFGIFAQMITLFVIVAVGYGAKKAHFMTVEFDQMLSKLILNIALSGLIIGSSLANMPARELIGGPRLWIASLFRLALIPLCIWFVFHFFVSNMLLLGAIVVISGMPVATNGTMLCYQYGGNSHTMAQGTFVTTVLSLVSIPLLVQFLSLVC